MIENLIRFFEACGVNKAAQQVEFLRQPATIPFALWETLYVTILGTLLAYVGGLPLGVILVIGDENGLCPLPKPLMKALRLKV